jgi:putative hydrolase of the HAD superfamily
MIKAIIFDFAGVIVGEGYWNWLYKNILDISLKEVHFMDLSKKVDSVQITTEELLLELSKESGKTPQQIEKEMFDEFILNTELLSYIQELHKKYKTGFLSNFPREWKEKLFEKYDLAKYFDAVVVSTENGGVIKPSPEIYKIILERLGVQPEEAIFIDDRKSNTEGAENVGISGIIFKSNNQLKKDLSDFGVSLA